MTAIPHTLESRKKFGTFPRGFAAGTMFPWPLVPAGELVELRYGKSLTEGNRRPGDIPVFGTNGRCGWHNERLAEGPGVILGRKGMGPLGVEWCESDFWVIDTAYFASPKRNDLDLKYFYYLAKYIGLNHLKDGTSNPSLSRESFYLQLLPFPSLREQHEIARIMTDLDRKIDLNIHMNQTLEAMARAIFKSWFVDFDPVKEGHPLFPATLAASRLSSIPESWRIGSLLEQADLMSGGTPKTSAPEYWDGEIPWASAGDVSQCGEVFLIRTQRSITSRGLEESSTQVIPPWSTVVVARGATTGRHVMFGAPIAMNQTCYALRSKFGADAALYCQIGNLISKIVHASHGSVFDTITTRTFQTHAAVLPDQDVLLAFDNKVRPLFELILCNQQESLTLAALRDTLLPKLLSGEIRVKQAEKIVGEAT